MTSAVYSCWLSLLLSSLYVYHCVFVDDVVSAVLIVVSEVFIVVVVVAAAVVVDDLDGSEILQHNVRPSTVRSCKLMSIS